MNKRLMTTSELALFSMSVLLGTAGHRLIELTAMNETRWWVLAPMSVSICCSLLYITQYFIKNHRTQSQRSN